MFPTPEQIMQCWWAYTRSCSAGNTSSLLRKCQHLILLSARKLLNWDLDQLISVSDISVTSCAVIHDTCGLFFGRQIMKEIGTNNGHMPTSKFQDSILLRNSFLNWDRHRKTSWKQICEINITMHPFSTAISMKKYGSQLLARVVQNICLSSHINVSIDTAWKTIMVSYPAAWQDLSLKNIMATGKLKKIKF